MSEGDAPGLPFLYASITRVECSPSNSRTRLCISLSCIENMAAAAPLVSSVRVEPSITGTSAETEEAVGWKGCCGNTSKSTAGENPIVI